MEFENHRPQPDTRRVLLVEDSDSDAQLYTTMVQELQADTVANPTTTPVEVDRVAALDPGMSELIEGGTEYDVVLLDLNLPDATGLETLERVIETDPTAAIVVLTGVGDRQLGEKAVDKGAQDFLIKDHVTPRVLDKAISYAQTRKAQTKQIERQRNTLTVLNWLLRHEIRNDASIIQGWASTLEADSPKEERSLARMNNASDHILTITKSAGELISTLKQERTELSPIELTSVLDAEMARLREDYDSVSLSLTEEVPEEVSVRANQFLGTVLANVLRNAAEHNDTDSPSVEVTVQTPTTGDIEAAADTDALTTDTDATAATTDTVTTIDGGADEYVWVTVRDDGPGIPNKIKQNITEIHRSGDTPSDIDGTHTGIYMIIQFMNQYDGEVRIKENSPRGAIVKLGFVPA